MDAGSSYTCRASSLAQRDVGSPGALTTALVIAMLGLWVLAKVILFRGLEYTSDLITNIQLSRGWLQGQPLLHDNRFGSAARVHNYYLTPVLGPLTAAWGAYGLFAAHAVLLFAACLAFDRAVRPLPPGRRAAQTLTLLFGPVAFWLWDDPVYGWHVELLCLPLAVLLMDALQRRSRLRWLWGGLLVLMRVEGAVVACCLFLLHAWLGPDRVCPWRRHGLVRSSKIVAVWMSVFALGMALLVLQGGRSSRLSATLAALPALVSDRQVIAATVLGLTATLLLFLSGLLIASLRQWPAALLAALPVLLVASVASASYLSGGPDQIRIFGPSWPPRFVMLWSIVVVTVMCVHPVGKPRYGAQRSPRAFWLTIIASIAAQCLALNVGRHYDMPARLEQALRGQVLANRLSPRERSFLSCLARELPPMTPIAMHGTLFSYFHRHDVIWPDFLQTAGREPSAVVCDLVRGRLPTEPGCSALLSRWQTAGLPQVLVDGIGVAYLPSLRPAIDRCNSGQ